MEVDIAPDERISVDEGYAESTNTSYLSSLASEVRQGVLENGRTYASFGKTLQGMPIDEKEQDRNDLQHAKFMLLLGGKLHLAPIASDPQKILDLGTGSGIWSIDMAENHPSATVTGVDIAATMPEWVPPNVQFEIEDVEEDWLFAKDSFDFIFGRELLMAIRDWPRMIKQAYDHLKPGGYLELQMTFPKTFCEDGSLDLDTSRVSSSDLCQVVKRALWETLFFAGPRDIYMVTDFVHSKLEPFQVPEKLLLQDKGLLREFFLYYRRNLEIHLEIRTRSNTDDFRYAESARLLFECGRKMGVPWEASLEWKKQFNAAGFEEVTETVLPIPIGRWPKDKSLKKIGTFELANIDQGLDAFSLRGFTTALQRSEDELRVLTALARKELFDPSNHLNVK